MNTEEIVYYILSGFECPISFDIVSYTGKYNLEMLSH